MFRMSATVMNTSRQARWPLVINQWLLQAVPHMQQTLSQLVSVANSGPIHTLLKERPNGIIAHLLMAFILVSRYAKVIKIHQELWSQMYCHIFVAHSVGNKWSGGVTVDMNVWCTAIAAQEHTDLLEAFMSFLSQVSLSQFSVFIVPAVC